MKGTSPGMARNSLVRVIMTAVTPSEPSLLISEIDSRYILSDPPDLTRSIAAGRWKELNILLHSVALLGEDLDTRRSLSPLLRASVAIVSADKALLYQWDEAFSGLRLSTSLGFEEEPDGVNQNAQAHACLLNRKPVLVSSPGESFLRDELAWTGCASALTVPITHQGLPWGALQLLRDRPFSKDDAILLWIFGLILEGVLPIHLGVKRLREMVGALDPATGLLTPAHFRRRLAWELQRSAWIARPLALACIEVTETLHGRPLRASGLPFTTRDAARYAQKALRQHDSLTCLGGHQFLVAMPDTTLTDAGRVVELIREAFLTRAAGTLPSYAVASGLVTYPENGQTEEEMIRAACVDARRSTGIASRNPRGD